MRKVWVADLPSAYREVFGIGQVLIEQFDDDPPTVAFREHSGAVWGPPNETEVAP
jgi:hypothetical protein